jgi:hypothetical protein
MLTTPPPAEITNQEKGGESWHPLPDHHPVVVPDAKTGTACLIRSTITSEGVASAVMVYGMSYNGPNGARPCRPRCLPHRQ